MLAITPVASVTGLVSLSIDGLGTNDPAGGIVQVDKPSAEATVRSAYMAAASTGFSGYTLVDGDVMIDGAPVIWDTAISPVPSNINSHNSWADVTALVKPKIDAAAPGRIDFLVAEPSNSAQIDGEILVVIFDDPAQPANNTIILLFGAQDVAGDNFNVLLANPIDKTNPNLALDTSLGISFGFQPSGQFSQIDVNGTRLTTSAGGQDDGASEDGALLTVGGLDDTNANPPDPFASNQPPRYDDELYDLLPFVNTGDTTISVATANPSADDNIFFAAFNLKSTIAVIGEGIVLSPSSQEVPVGGSATATATLQDEAGNPLVGRTVEFEVISGPNAGLIASAVTDENGQGVFSYSSTLAGDDIVLARFFDSHEQIQSSLEVTITWLQEREPPIDIDNPIPTPLPPPTVIDPPVLTPPPPQPSLLLSIPPRQSPFAISADYGTNGYLLEQADYSSVGTPQAIDLALGNDEVNEAFLLAGFLDFVDPEMLVVDLGDEPPARVVGDSSKPAEQAAMAEAQAGGNAGAAKVPPDGSVNYMKPPLDAAMKPSGIAQSASAIQSFVTTNWKWFASTAAALLLGGAAWKSRDAWLQAARNLRSR